MRNETRRFFLKEYGSWSVLIISYVTGLAVSRGFTWKAIPLFLALALLINSKQSLTGWLRRKDRVSLGIFLLHFAAASVIFFAVFGSDLPRLLPLLVFPAAYLFMNAFMGEHFVLTEVLGFTLISLAAALAKFVIVGGFDVRLFAAVALYFIAGVFKVKALLLKKMRYRIITVLYLLLTVIFYQRFYISLIVLLPLVDNLVAAATLYKTKLKTTGWIEVSKSLLFLLLMIYFF